MTTVQLKRVARFGYGDSLAADGRRDGGVPVFGSNGRIGWHDRSNTRGPVIVVGRKGSFGKVQYSPEPVFAIDTTYYIDRTQTSNDIRWLYYLLLATDLSASSADTGVPGLNRDDAYQRRVHWVPMDKQRLIADFLDRETQRIDALADAKRRMIDLVQEKVISCIEDFVHAPAPRHTVLKRVCQSIQTGPFGSQVHMSDYLVGGTPFVNPTDIHDSAIVLNRTITVDDAKRSELARHLLKVGDVVLARRGEMGRCAVVSDQEAGALCGTGSLRLRFDTNVAVPDFYQAVISSRRAVDFFLLHSVGSTMDNLSATSVGELPVPVPPLFEQVRVVEKLRQMRGVHAALARSLVAQLDLLAQYRQALITKAVTGQLDEATLKGKKPADEVVSV